MTSIRMVWVILVLQSEYHKIEYTFFPSSNPLELAISEKTLVKEREIFLSFYVEMYCAFEE